MILQNVISERTRLHDGNLPVLKSKSDRYKRKKVMCATCDEMEGKFQEDLEMKKPYYATWHLKKMRKVRKMRQKIKLFNKIQENEENEGFSDLKELFNKEGFSVLKINNYTHFFCNSIENMWRGILAKFLEKLERVPFIISKFGFLTCSLIFILLQVKQIPHKVQVYD